MGSSTPRGRALLAFSRQRVVAFRAVRRRRLPETPDFGAQYPACRYPCPTLQVQHYCCSHMARGQGGSLFLPCTTLSFATLCRFIPALSGLRARPHLFECDRYWRACLLHIEAHDRPATTLG